MGCGLLAMLTACNGIFDDIYDEPATPAAGDIYIDASDWTQWHYIDHKKGLTSRQALILN